MLSTLSEAENATALVKLLNFHGIGPVRGAVENVVLWAVDNNEDSREPPNPEKRATAKRECVKVTFV